MLNNQETKEFKNIVKLIIKNILVRDSKYSKLEILGSDKISLYNKNNSSWDFFNEEGEFKNVLDTCFFYDNGFFKTKEEFCFKDSYTEKIDTSFKYLGNSYYQKKENNSFFLFKFDTLNIKFEKIKEFGQFSIKKIDEFFNESDYILKNEDEKETVFYKNGLEIDRMTGRGNRFSYQEGNDFYIKKSYTEKNKSLIDFKGNVIHEKCEWLSADKSYGYNFYYKEEKDKKDGIYQYINGYSNFIIEDSKDFRISSNGKFNIKRYPSVDNSVKCDGYLSLEQNNSSDKIAQLNIPHENDSASIKFLNYNDSDCVYYITQEATKDDTQGEDPNVYDAFGTLVKYDLKTKCNTIIDTNYHFQPSPFPSFYKKFINLVYKKGDSYSRKKYALCNINSNESIVITDGNIVGGAKNKYVIINKNNNFFPVGTKNGGFSIDLMHETILETISETKDIIPSKLVEYIKAYSDLFKPSNSFENVEKQKSR